MPKGNGPYRDSIKIYLDMCRVLSEAGVAGSIVSTISRKANLSHYEAISKMQFLIDNGYVGSEKGVRGMNYKLLHNGYIFLEKCDDPIIKTILDNGKNSSYETVKKREKANIQAD